MTTRQLVFAVLLYVSADLSNPFMLGAFCFSPEQSVEATGGVQHPRKAMAVSWSRFKLDTPELARLSSRTGPDRGARARATAFDEWFVDLRRAHTPFHEPPSAADDH